MPNFYDLTLEEIRSSEKTATFRAIDEPILVFNRFELKEIFFALGATIFFGVVLGSWALAALAIAASLILMPKLRHRFPKGIFTRMLSDRFSELPIGPFTWGRLTYRGEKNEYSS
jgi:hypothetical protein